MKSGYEILNDPFLNKGTAFTKEQAKLLKRYTSNILLCFDMDKAGITATEKASYILKSENFKVKVINFTGSKDPDDFLRKYGKEEDGYVNYVKGANIAGFVKVADAMLAQGVV